MKTIALCSLLVCATLSWSVFADEHDSANAKFSSMKEKCKDMGERHGLSDDRMASWMDRCMKMAKLPRDDVESKGMSKDDMGGMDHMHDSNDMKDRKDDGEMGKSSK